MFHIEQGNIFEGLSSNTLEGFNQQNVIPRVDFRCEGEAAAADKEQPSFGVGSHEKGPLVKAKKNKRKRGRTSKTSEEVERQRMTHIAVERNRRMQMNQHLQILRSLMPNSYVQRVLESLLFIYILFSIMLLQNHRCN